MASKKDMRRTDLGTPGLANRVSVADKCAVVPYVEPKTEKDSDISSTFSSTLPMAAVSLKVSDSKAR